MSEQNAEKVQIEEVARLRAEVEHWKAHAEEAGEGFARVCKDYARVSARNSELVRRIEALADEWENDGFDMEAGRLRDLSTPPGEQADA